MTHHGQLDFARRQNVLCFPSNRPVAARDRSGEHQSRSHVNHMKYLIASLWLSGYILLSLSAVGYSQEQSLDKSEATYTTTDVDFQSHDRIPLYGRLVLPKSRKPRAIVVAVQTAEGATIDMKRPLGNGKTFNYFDLYREQLAAMDIGFFSYEGRGIRMGDAPPRYETIDRELYNSSTLANKVQDVLTAVDTVHQQEGLQNVPVFLLGASEGTLLAAEAASMKPDKVAGLVLYGVMARNLRETFRFIMSGGEFLKYRSLDQDQNDVITKDEWENVVKDVEFSKADIDSNGKFTVADIEILTRKYLDAIDNDDFQVLHEWAKVGAAVSIPDGWFKDHFMHTDNMSILPQLDIPVGCFHGDLDRMTPISAVRELEQKAKNAGLTKMEFHYFEGLDHSLNIGQYFAKGKMPKGHQAIFEFIDRVAPAIHSDVNE